MLSQPSLLLALVAKELRDGKPPDRLSHRVGFGGNHPRERRSHLGTEGDFTIAFVLEGVELADDLVTTFPGVELEGLQRRAVVLYESVFPRHVAPDGHQVVADGELLGIK